jgi:uncharacterized LabA/DUF88 family protein
MKSVYLFIDGGHLRTNYRQTMSPWFGGDGRIDFNRVKDTFKAEKCFYYDCRDDLKRDGESDDGYAARVAEQDSYFNAIQEIPGCHVRLGNLAGQGKKKRQKEVDILLAVDILNHAVRDNLLRATLLTGDRDFKPVVDSLVQMGVFISVAGDQTHMSKELAWAADSFTPLTFSHYFDWTDRKLQQKYALGVRQINMPPAHVQTTRVGTWRGTPVTLSMAPGGHVFYIDVPKYQDADHLAFEGNDPDRMTLYFELQYGKVEWSQ